MAFYGYGGDDDEVSKPFDEDSEYYRPNGYDCGIEGILYDFASSMSKPWYKHRILNEFICNSISCRITIRN